MKLRNVVYKVPFFSKLKKNWDLKKRYRVEKALLAQKPLEASNKTSIIHFSINKAATQYVSSVLIKIGKENELIPVSLHGYSFQTNAIPYLDHLSDAEMEHYKHVFKPQGFLYSVFGGMIRNIDEFDRYKILLSIRDPRDILVSNFYSRAYNHPIPPAGTKRKETFLKKRKWARSVGIDQYVLSESDRVFQVFSRYQKELVEPFDNVGILKYEDMVQDHENWLLDLAQKGGLKLSGELKEKINEEFQQHRPQKEDIKAHQRKGIIGDHQNKLKKDTIQNLNKKFEKILGTFGYL